MQAEDAKAKPQTDLTVTAILALHAQATQEDSIFERAILGACKHAYLQAFVCFCVWVYICARGCVCVCVCLRVCVFGTQWAMLCEGELV